MSFLFFKKMDIVGCKKFRPDQLDKIGNTAIYLSNAIGALSKTKLLKLLYILDELSIERSGIPFLNLQYKAWKYGPVSKELYDDLKKDLRLLSPYICRRDDKYVSAAPFNDDEFSDNDIALMDEVINSFKEHSSKDLKQYTHRKGSPWYNAALKYGVLAQLESEKLSETDIIIDMSQLVAKDQRKKGIYQDYIEAF